MSLYSEFPTSFHFIFLLYLNREGNKNKVNSNLAILSLLPVSIIILLIQKNQTKNCVRYLDLIDLWYNTNYNYLNLMNRNRNTSKYTFNSIVFDIVFQHSITLKQHVLHDLTWFSCWNRIPVKFLPTNNYCKP